MALLSMGTGNSTRVGPLGEWSIQMRCTLNFQSARCFTKTGRGMCHHSPFAVNDWRLSIAQSIPSLITPVGSFWQETTSQIAKAKTAFVNLGQLWSRHDIQISLKRMQNAIVCNVLYDFKAWLLCVEDARKPSVFDHWCLGNTGGAWWENPVGNDEVHQRVLDANSYLLTEVIHHLLFAATFTRAEGSAAAVRLWPGIKVWRYPQFRHLLVPPPFQAGPQEVRLSPVRDVESRGRMALIAKLVPHKTSRIEQNVTKYAYRNTEKSPLCCRLLFSPLEYILCIVLSKCRRVGIMLVLSRWYLYIYVIGLFLNPN